MKQATGRDLTLKGRIRLGLSLQPTLTVEDVAFANPPGFSRPQMATLERLDLKLALIPLLSQPRRDRPAGPGEARHPAGDRRAGPAELAVHAGRRGPPSPQSSRAPAPQDEDADADQRRRRADRERHGHLAR